MADQDLNQQAMNQVLIGELSNLSKVMRTEFKGLTEEVKKLQRRTKKSNESSEKLVKGFAPVTGLLKNFGFLIAGVSTLVKAITGANERIKISAATNIDVVKMSRRLEESMQGVLLSNELTGEAYQSGARHLSGRMLTLAREMKMSGEGYKQLFSAFAGFEGILGFNEEASIRLVEILDETSDTYQMSTDRLVGALVKLTDTLAPLALTGGSQETVNAMAMVAGKMGTRGMDILQPIMGQIMRAAADPAALARASAGFPGLTQFVRAMESGASAQLQAQMLESLIKRGGTRFTGNLSDISLSQRAFGTGLLPMLSQARQAMANTIDLPGGTTGEPQTVESLLAKLVDPINKLADIIVPETLKFVNNVADAWVKELSPRIQTFGTWLDTEVPRFFGILRTSTYDIILAFHNLKNHWLFRKFFEEDTEDIRAKQGLEMALNLGKTNDNLTNQLIEDKHLNYLNKDQRDSLHSIERKLEENKLSVEEQVILGQEFNELLRSLISIAKDQHSGTKQGIFTERKDKDKYNYD